MKRLLMVMVVLGCATAWSANAQDASGRQGLSEEQTKERQSVIEKYDTDGDGVLSKSERKGLSKEDKRTLAKTGGVGTSGKAPRVDKDKANEAKGRDQEHDKPSKRGQGGKANGANGSKGHGGRK